jgi:hypothetical protein
MNKTIFIFFILYFIFISNISCTKKHNNKTEKLEPELTTCENEQKGNDIENTFILKTNLSDTELEELLSQDFSSVSDGKNKNKRKRKNNNDDLDVKQFKSKDNLNKTILLVEINNITELSNETTKSNNPYELIDVKKDKHINFLLNFDSFFKAKYQEMFEYYYTIVMFLFVLLGMIIYSAFILPQEASERIVNGPILDISNNSINNNNIDNDYHINE